jgi:hypothetical protein
MKIIITQPTVCGGNHVSIDDVIDATESDARLLIRIGKADTYSEPLPTPSDNDDQGPLIPSRIAKVPRRKVSRSKTSTTK